MTSALDDDSVVSRAYDSLGRTVTETQNGRQFTFGHDDRGRVTSVTYPDGTVESRTSDAAGRLTVLGIQGGPTLSTLQFVGVRLKSETLGNGDVRTISYDPLWRTTSVDLTQGAASVKKFTYGWSAASHRTYEKRHHAAGTGDNYGLDSLYRRTVVKVGVSDPALEDATPGSQTVTSTHAITYDAAGSRMLVAVTGAGAGTTAYGSDPRNFYTAVGGATHVRDAAGNRRDDGTLLFTYDYRSQLVEVRLKATGATVAAYEYDAVGRRTSKTTGGATRTFAWIGYELGVEYDSAGVFSRRHYGARTGEVATAYHRDLLDLDADGLISDAAWIYPVYDGANDCAGVTGPAGGVVESYGYSYDGNVTVTDAAGSAIAATALGWQQGYHGYYRDDESGLLYATLRYYDPEIGRFVTEDPIGRWGDSSSLGNGYAFLGNAYRSGHDPYGLDRTACPCGAQKSALVMQADIMTGFVAGTLPRLEDESVRLVKGLSDAGYGVKKVKFTQASKTALFSLWGGDPGSRSELRSFKESKLRTILDDTLRNRFWNHIREAAKDPCFTLLYIAGHGADGKVMLSDWGTGIGAGEVAVALGLARLEILGLNACECLQSPDWKDLADAHYGSEQKIWDGKRPGPEGEPSSDSIVEKVLRAAVRRGGENR